MAGGLDRIDVQNDPVNLVDPLGLIDPLTASLVVVLVADIGHGFLVPGPPETPTQAVGSFARYLVDNYTSVDVDGAANDVYNFSKDGASYLWESYYKRHINPNWRNDPTDPYYPGPSKHSVYYWEQGGVRYPEILVPTPIPDLLWESDSACN